MPIVKSYFTFLLNPNGYTISKSKNKLAVFITVLMMTSIQKDPNTWKGYYGKYAITIIQRHRHHDIKEGDVEFEKDPSYKEDPETTYAVPSKAAIAQALNGHLNRIYG